MDKICRTKCPPLFDVAGATKRPEMHYKYQCNYDERKRKAESRRRKMVQKIKCEYRIDVDGLNAMTVEDMIAKVEAFEKQKRIREKAKTERRLCFVRRLLQEEKYKRRGIRMLPASRKPKTVKQPSVISNNLDPLPGVPEMDVENLYCEDQKTPPRTMTERTRTGEIGPGTLVKTVKLQKPTETVKETELECNPSSITFENCEPNKTYTQTYRITNIGLDIIHCRYIGIQIETDQAAPFQVEVSDNALLRPGLSFSSKIHLFSPTEMPELQCHLVYESRRKNKPKERGIFRIPLSSVPGRSIADVSPSVIRFPSVTWCVATGPERSKYLRKSIRIRNMGAKDCSCVIVKKVRDPDRELQAEGEADSRVGDHSDGYAEAIANLAEMIDNVFEVFRFSRRYFISVPAMSAVTVDVEFVPEYKGYHHEVVFVRFEGSHNCTEEKIELIGDIKKVPLRIEPMTIDLNICTVNSGVYEGTFRIYNDSSSSLPVRVKVPGSMKEHSSVYPSCPVIQPRSYQTCSVKLFPRLTIHSDAFRYYKEDTSVLEFPVFIQPTGSNPCKREKLKLYVFAILTDYSLELQPAEINFGAVNALETVRTEITLTNHSMTELDYGFLHLPMGVRIEPNAGFGVILPKETISLHLLYSPILNSTDAEGKYSFQVQVTTIQELGSFRERQPNAETGSTDQLTIMDEGFIYNTEDGETPKILSVDNSTTEDEDEEPSFIDPVEELRILEEKQNRIREYLRQKVDTSPTSRSMDGIALGMEEQGKWSERNLCRKDANVISCKAVLIKPFCRLSATVLQLPATPLSSFSITRLRLNCTNPLEKCNCGYAGKLSNRRSFEARFEFATSSDLVTIVPRVGHIMEGDSVPISIIFKPEFSKEELSYQSKVLKAELLYEEEIKSKEKSNSKTKSAKPNRQGSRQKKLEIESRDVNLATLDITPCDLFAGQKALQQMIDPFTLTLKAICRVTAVPCSGMPERVEQHSLTLIAPVIKPRFIFLGKCQEIRFGKVTVGDRAKKVLEIQNISLKRIALRVSALNPHGPFTCTTGCKKDKIDPEHIWRHPITFSPAGERGKEEEFFEIRCGATSIPLTVNGEGVTPKLTLTPNFELCVLEIAPNVISEVEFNIENAGEAHLTLQFVADGVKASSNFRSDVMALDTNRSKISDFGLRKSDRTNYTAKRRAIFTEDVPHDVAIQLENDFTPVDNPPENLFSIEGLDSNDEVIVSPSCRLSLKIKCCLIKDGSVSSSRESSTITSAYAIRYKLMLAKTTLLKEFVIIGTMNPYK